jgi:hypothetical protein
METMHKDRGLDDGLVLYDCQFAFFPLEIGSRIWLGTDVFDCNGLYPGTAILQGSGDP